MKPKVKCCFNCNNSRRKIIDGAAHTVCTLDGHWIDFHQSVEHCCVHWRRDRDYIAKPKKREKEL